MLEYESIKVGCRVELVHMEDTLTDLKPGDQGIVYKIDESEDLIWVNWDNGEQLALIIGVDEYKIINN